MLIYHTFIRNPQMESLETLVCVFPFAESPSSFLPWGIAVALESIKTLRSLLHLSVILFIPIMFLSSV